MQGRIIVTLIAALAALSSSASFPAADPPSNPVLGTLLVVAGTDTAGYSGDGGPAIQAQLSSPAGLAFDTAGNLCITELDGGRVRRVTPSGIISTLVGGGETPPRPVDGIPAARALLGDVAFLTFDRAGSLFISGYFTHRVWRLGPDGLISTIEDQIVGPTGVAADAAGNVYLADFSNDRVLKMTPEGSFTTVAGGGTKLPQTADGGPAVEAQLNAPMDMTVDAAGNLYIAQEFDHRVRRVSPDGIITTVAGIGESGFSGDGGPATQARLKGPTGLAVDSAGNLFISDRDDYRVRRVTPDGIIQTVAGNGKPKFSGAGGPASSAGLRGPTGLAVDAAGNLFIAETVWWDKHTGRGTSAPSERILAAVGIAAPGLIAGKPFPNP